MWVYDSAGTAAEACHRCSLTWGGVWGFQSCSISSVSTDRFLTLFRLCSERSAAVFTQGHNYMIYEDVGCYPVWSPSSLYFASAILPILVCAASSGFLLRRALRGPQSGTWTLRKINLQLMIPGGHITWIIFLCANSLADSGRARAEAASVVGGMGIPTEEWTRNTNLWLKLVFDQVLYCMIASEACVANLLDGTMPKFWDRIRANHGSVDLPILAKQGNVLTAVFPASGARRFWGV